MNGCPGCILSFVLLQPGKASAPSCAVHLWVDGKLLFPFIVTHAKDGVDRRTAKPVGTPL